MTRALTLTEAADVLSCSREYIGNAIKKGDLVALRIGRTYRIFPEHLGEFIKSKRYVPAVSRRVKAPGVKGLEFKRICMKARAEVLGAK